MIEKKRGGARPGAGRKKSPRTPRHIAMTDEEWQELKTLSGGPQKISAFIRELLKFYKEKKWIL